VHPTLTLPSGKRNAALIPARRRRKIPSAARPPARERLHVRPPRAAGAQVPRRALGAMGRAVVLGRGQHLRDEDEEHHLPSHLRVCAGSAARPEGDDEQEGGIAPHPA
jgi:hypothetical protein